MGGVPQASASQVLRSSGREPWQLGLGFRVWASGFAVQGLGFGL